MTLKAQRRPPNYPERLETLGDHIKSRRLTLGLFQKQVADELGTDETTLFRWERNTAQPQIPYLPRILKFLGYDPFPNPVSLADKLRAARRTLGLSQNAFAKRLGVDPCTVRCWERGKRQPSKKLAQCIAEFLENRNATGRCPDAEDYNSRYSSGVAVHNRI